MAQQLFNLGRTGLGMLPADSQARHLASQFMKAKRGAYPLLARHDTVAINLSFQCGLRRHFGSI
jgi:hypothetical protein